MSEVFFPPRALCDLVVKFKDVSYHVHRVVLHRHSKYLRALVPPPKKRKNEDAEPLVVDLQGVNQPFIDTHRFSYMLKCMYFPKWASAIPFIASTTLDLEAPEEDLELWTADFVPFTHESFTTLAMKPHSKPGHLEPSFDCSLLDVFSYFQCDYLVDRCKTVLLSDCIRICADGAFHLLQSPGCANIPEIEKKCIKAIVEAPREEIMRALAKKPIIPSSCWQKLMTEMVIKRL